MILGLALIIAVGLLPDEWRAGISDVALVGGFVLTLIGLGKFYLRRLERAIDARLVPVHERIDLHMDNEEQNLAATRESLAWTQGALVTLAASLGVRLDPPPVRDASKSER